MNRSRAPRRIIKTIALTIASVVLFAASAFADTITADADSLVASNPHPNSQNATQPAGTTVAYDFSAMINNSGNSSNDVFTASGGSVSVSIGRSGTWLDASPGSPASFTFTAYATPQVGTIRITVPSGTAVGTERTMAVTLTATASNGQSMSPNSQTLTYIITSSAGVDTTPPDTTIVNKPNNPTNSQSASFTYTSTESGTFQCSLDGAAFSTCPIAGINYSGLAAGSHTFEVAAKDAANNVDPSPASHTWVIDLTAPNTTIVTGPDPVTNETSADFTYTSSESNSTFQCSLDGAAFTGCPVDGIGYTGLAAGNHTFEVNATDAAGNTEASAASHAWTIDLTPPAVSAPDLVDASDTGVSAIDDKTKDDTPTLTATAEEGSTLELLNGTDVVYTTTIPAGGSWSFTSPSLADGSYTFKARATDAAGNSATSAGLTVLVDGTAPSIGATAKKADLSSYTAGTWSNQAVTVTFSCNDGGSGVDTLSGPQTFSSDGADQSAPGSCSDVAGNSASTIFSNIDVDRTAPTITLASRTPANANGWNNGDVTVVWNCADLLSGPVSHTVSTTKSAEGANQTASGTCSDNAGNTAGASETGINIDKTAPTITFFSRTPAANGYGWNNSPVTVVWNCADTLSGPADASVSDTKSAQNAGQTASATCFDLAGNSAGDSVSGINIDLTDPTITFASRTAANSNGWNNDDVEVTWNCADDLSGVVSATVSSTSTTEGENQNTSGTCYDKAGNSKSESLSDVNIDKSPPTIAFLTRTPANGNGWNDAPVTVQWTCSDSLSGVEDETVSDTVSTDGVNQTASATCTDLAGNTASDSLSGINIDTADPQIAFNSRTPAANTNGWNDSPVTVTWDCADLLSGVESDTVSDTVSTDGVNQTASATCADLAGNTASASLGGINIDSVDPSIALNSRTPANGNGWNNTDVIVVWDCTDDLSGVEYDTVSDTKTAELAGQTASGTCTDLAGNSAGATETGINIDKTAPSVAYLSATSSPNGNGWYNTDVTATFRATDNLSGFDSSGTPTQDGNSTTSGEGSAVTVGSPAFTDQAGNIAPADTATSDAYKIDKTAPAVSAWNGGPADGASYYFGSVPGAPTCTASDGLSGPDGCAVTGYSALVGSHTMAATAHDKAGNSGTATRSYTVLAWTMSGFFQPVDMSGVWNTVKAGSTVPLKWRMFAGATEIKDVAMIKSVTAASVACVGGSEDAIEETVTTTGGTVLRYDGTQFIDNWQTPKKPGWCYRVTMTAMDGSTIKALFKLK